MIHAKFFKPRVFPWNSVRQPEQIDRAQAIGGDLTLNREKVYEVGRDGLLGYRKQTPSFTYSMTQYEYGSMSFWYDLANKETPGTGDDIFVELSDLTTTKSDIAAFLTDDNDTFMGTVLFPKLRVNGFTLNVGDPDAIVERTFDLVGEDYKLFEEKYFAYISDTVETAETIKTITLSPAAIEFASGKYIFRVLRVRNGAVSELEEDATSTYDNNSWRYSTGTVIVQTCEVGDLIKVYYVADTAYTTTWTDNDVDPDLLLAEHCEIRMKVGTDTRIYRLQSIGVDVSFDRTDYKEVGNSEVVQTGVTAKTVKISLDRFAEDMSLEQILANDNTYPYIDPREFAEDIQVQILIYGEKEHTNFKIGYLLDNISPTAIGTSQDIEAYNKRTVALECDNLRISTDVAELAFA
jgi:hypothetical protein